MPKYNLLDSNLEVTQVFEYVAYLSKNGLIQGTEVKSFPDEDQFCIVGKNNFRYVLVVAPTDAHGVYKVNSMHVVDRFGVLPLTWRDQPLNQIQSRHVEAMLLEPEAPGPLYYLKSVVLPMLFVSFLVTPYAHLLPKPVSVGILVAVGALYGHFPGCFDVAMAVAFIAIAKFF
jgi:hypothetical protein